MPDLQDEESELAGNGGRRVSEDDRMSHSNDETSPSSAKDRKASESDPPRKKRKVNTACVYCRRSVRRFLLQIVSALPNLDRRARNIMG